MDIVFSAMMPHAPIIIPEVGGRRQAECQATHQSCLAISSACLRTSPDVIVLFSPHTPLPLKGRGISFRTAPLLNINFSAFGCLGLSWQVPNFLLSFEEFLEPVSENFLPCPGSELDHGAGVPLHFLCQAGWKGQVLIASPDYRSLSGSIQAAADLRRALSGKTLRVAVIASADMSHALKPGAPGGFNPEAADYDRDFSAIIKSGNFSNLREIHPRLAALARQDSLDTTLMALELSGGNSRGSAFLSYEAPFGVGYLCAVLNSGDTF